MDKIDINEVHRALCDIAIDAGYTHEGVDVRLCVEENGDWTINAGDVSYDTRHSPYCAASEIGPRTKKGDLLDTARALISDIEDQIAESAE